MHDRVQISSELSQEPLEASEQKASETSQLEKPGQISEVFYHEWKSLARCKDAEASIVWVRETARRVRKATAKTVITRSCKICQKAIL